MEDIICNRTVRMILRLRLSAKEIRLESSNLTGCVRTEYYTVYWLKYIYDLRQHIRTTEMAEIR